MKTPDTQKLLHIFIVLSTGFLFSYCSSPNSQKEAQKLIDKQISVIDAQQQANEEFFKKARDSIKKEELRLTKKQQAVSKAIDEFEKQKQQEEIADLSGKKTRLTRELNAINDTLSSLRGELKRLEEEKSELTIKTEQVDDQQVQAKQAMVTGIEEIDKRLDKAEKQKITKVKEIEINKKKIELANQKILLLKNEKNLYLREKNDLQLKQADRDAIASIDKKINDTDKQISRENEKITSANQIINSNKDWMADFKDLKQQLNQMMQKEYDKKATIDSFSKNEIQRLEKEKFSIESERNSLNKTLQKMQAEKMELDTTLSGIDREIEVLKSGELSEVLKNKSDLGTLEANLAEEEAHSDLRVKQKEIEDTTGNPEGYAVLGALEKQLEQRRNEIDGLKMQVARERKTIADKQAQIDKKRATRVKTTGSAFILILLGVIVLTGLYFIGKRNQQRRKSKST